MGTFLLWGIAFRCGALQFQPDDFAYTHPLHAPPSGVKTQRRTAGDKVDSAALDLGQAAGQYRQINWGTTMSLTLGRLLALVVSTTVPLLCQGQKPALSDLASGMEAGAGGQRIPEMQAAANAMALAYVRCAKAAIAFLDDNTSDPSTVSMAVNQRCRETLNSKQEDPLMPTLLMTLERDLANNNVGLILERRALLRQEHDREGRRSKPSRPIPNT